MNIPETHANRRTVNALQDEAGRVIDAVADIVATKAEDTVDSVQVRATRALRRAGERLQEIEETWDQVKDVGVATTNFIRTKPFQALGIAVVAGIIAGIYVRRH